MSGVGSSGVGVGVGVGGEIDGGVVDGGVELGRGVEVGVGIVDGFNTLFKSLVDTVVDLRSALVNLLDIEPIDFERLLISLLDNPL